MADCASPEIPCWWGALSGRRACMEVCQHLVAEPNGGDYQHARELRGPGLRHDGCAAVGCFTGPNRAFGGAAGVGGAFQDLSLHLRGVDPMAPGAFDITLREE